MVTIDDFVKIDIRTVKVKTAERVEDSEKLIKLTVDIGEEEERQIIAGLGKSYEPESLIGKNAIAIVNLEPRKMMGLESQGMILATGDDLEKISLLTPDKNVDPGGKIR